MLNLILALWHALVLIQVAGFATHSIAGLRPALSASLRSAKPRARLRPDLTAFAKISKPLIALNTLKQKTGAESRTLTRYGDLSALPSYILLSMFLSYFRVFNVIFCFLLYFLILKLILWFQDVRLS